MENNLDFFKTNLAETAKFLDNYLEQMQESSIIYNSERGNRLLGMTLEAFNNPEIGSAVNTYLETSSDLKYLIIMEKKHTRAQEKVRTVEEKLEGMGIDHKDLDNEGRQ